ncbi:GvpL/GvpF family gas vesicle protein [Streptomyces sp. NPDC008238]
MYSYAVLLPFPGQDKALQHLRGIAGRRVRIVHTTDLAVAVSKVPRTEYNPKALRRRLEDLSWLEATARIHRSTVDALARHTSVLPLKFATVHQNQERLAAKVAEHHQHYTDALTSLAGLQEWEVTVYAMPPEHASTPMSHQGTGLNGTFLPVHAQFAEAGDNQHDALKVAGRLHEALTAVATASHQYPRRSTRLTAEPGTTVTSTAYLVPCDEAEVFTQLVKNAAAGMPGVQIELTGPGACYSFDPTAEFS